MTKFALETLESRRLLSASGVTAAVLNEEYKLQPSTPPILYVVTDPDPIALGPDTFSAFGTVTREFTTPDLGKIFHFTGTLMGTPGYTLKGRIQTPGNIASGRATGNLKFTDGPDKMFFTVKGPLQPGLSPLPTTFKYTVTTAAGNNLLGSKGTVTLARSAGHQFNFYFQPNS